MYDFSKRQWNLKKIGENRGRGLIGDPWNDTYKCRGKKK
jgi:hypothetical protein